MMKAKFSKRMLAFVLSLLVLLTAIPVGVLSFADITPDRTCTITTNMEQLVYHVGTATEFYFECTKGNVPEKTMVLGSFEFSDDSAVEKLEYWDVNTNTYREFYGDFGPPNVGFEFKDARSHFCVTFNKPGTYTVKAYMKPVGTNGIENALCATEATITVLGTSELTTTIGDEHFVVGRDKEFTFTTIANNDKANVLGYFEFSDISAVEKLEYWDVNTNTFKEFYGAFGPPDAGFQLTNATSRFRATFNKEGEYSVTALIKEFGTNIVLSTCTQKVVVKPQATISNNIATEIVYGEEKEFAVQSIANGDAGVQVWGTFSLTNIVGNTDATDAIENLWYKDGDGNWQEFRGDFGPPKTGFPIINGTSYFKVKFNRTGAFMLKTALVKADETRAEMCSCTQQIDVINADIVIGEGGITVSQVATEYNFEEGKYYGVDDLLKIDGVKTGDTVTYSMTKDGDFKSADDFKLVSDASDKATPAGDYTIYVKFERQYHNDKIVDEVKPITITVKPIDFNVAINGYEGTYDQKEHPLFDKDNSVFAKLDDETSINVSDLTFTYYNEETGEYDLTEMPVVKSVNDSKKYKVKVHYNNNYKDQEVEVEVKILKALMLIEFGTIEDVIYTDYPNNKFTNQISSFYFVDKENNKVPVEPEVNPTVVYSEECSFAEIIPESGEVIYSDIGDIKVTATLTGEYVNYKIGETDKNNNVVPSKAEYSVNVNVAQLPADLPCKLTGKNPYFDVDNNVSWFGSEVVVAPVDGWKIIEMTNDNVASSGVIALKQNWLETTTKSEKGIYENVSVAFKNIETGEITSIYEIPTFAIDDIAPIFNDENKIVFEQKNDNLFAKAINQLTFGVFFNKYLVVTVNAIDVYPDSNVTASGVRDYKLTFKTENGVEYSYEKSEDNKFIIEGDDYNAISNFLGSAYVKVTDRLENSLNCQITTENSNLSATDFMIENDAPIINVETANGTLKNEKFSFVFNVNDHRDNHYYSGLNCVQVLVNGVVEYSDFIVDDNNEHEQVIKKSYELSIDPKNKTFEDDPLDNWKNNGKAGELDIVVKVCDNAGNVSESAPTSVYFDCVKPVIENFKFETDDSKQDGSPVDVKDYGFWFKESVKVTVNAVDNSSDDYSFVSGIDSVKIYLHDVDVNKYYTVVNNASGDGYEIQMLENYESYVDNVNVIRFTNVAANQAVTFDVPANFKGQIYACTTDYATNSCEYVHPKASVVEDSVKHYDTSEITIKAPDPVSTQNERFTFSYAGKAESIDKVESYTDSQLVPLYNDAVAFNVSVEDIYSGIYKVKYTVLGSTTGNPTEEVNSTEVTINDEGEFSDDGNNGWIIDKDKKENNLVTCITNTIRVDGNYNNMVLLVELTDRCGNTSYDYYVFGIDKTAPVIDVTYSDDEINDSVYINYFKTNRKATITIKERNFDPDNVELAITNDHGLVPDVDLTKLSAWDVTIDPSDLDNTTYTAEISYTVDGDYAFVIDCVDKAENKADTVAGSFTIDKTVPTVQVVYDNNDVLNGNYYKANRVATITIHEHNFDASRVEIIGVATDNGAPVSFPGITGWRSNGDVHTTTISYAADAKYSFDINFKDMASNEIADFVPQEFYVDKTNPVISISGIVDQSANNDKGNIGFSISGTDTNFDKFAPVLTGVFYKDGAFETRQLSIGSAENIANGKKYTVSNLVTDGIYSITCTAVDRAGNAYSEVILHDINGKAYTQKRSGRDKLATFSINRDGSSFRLNEYTQKLVDTFYVKNVTENVTIIEINADKIMEGTLTLNGTVLEKGTHYNVSLDHGDATWYKYSYSINKDLFADEGEYNIVISSKDRATNEAFSDVKDLNVKFVVDRTAPAITVAGLKKNGKYRVDKQVVTLVPTDDGGMLKSLVVRTLDDDGNVISELINLSGDALIEAVEAGKITFELTKGDSLYQHVQIISEDMAVNIVGAETAEIYSNVTVTTNIFMMFWAIKPLRWGTIAGVTLLAAMFIFLVAKKKRKKEN